MNSVGFFNKKMQDIVIPENVPYMEFGEKVFKLGAKIIQKVNDYPRDIVNGEVGYILEILKPAKDNPLRMKPTISKCLFAIAVSFSSGICFQASITHTILIGIFR